MEDLLASSSLQIWVDSWMEPSTSREQESELNISRGRQKLPAQYSQEVVPPTPYSRDTVIAQV